MRKERYVARVALLVAFLLATLWVLVFANIVKTGAVLIEPNRPWLWAEFIISVIILIAVGASYLMLVLQEIKDKKRWEK